jgi:hypothetical protein
MLVLLERDLSAAQPLVQQRNRIRHRRGGVRDRRMVADERRVNLCADTRTTLATQARPTNRGEMFSSVAVNAKGCPLWAQTNNALNILDVRCECSFRAKNSLSIRAGFSDRGR